ncbi:hypothetical protein COV81_00150 [Candidatus Peregrinibacteria bacterium CG11_big_fil_rev_8_21_14_0_20_41_10]|nr:MAG: hypothetical protein COV81_00150 [Candidatus Peregrinibacteria bacterium CG11_big_fil_rev_8_21_14_0_20_41_10]PIZ73342.1 MAG: hypothetical protein COY06_05505 [Candidatus Peregrinibacteria bacterium CG_4_10_14_0_2_um_filter_41_8]
MLTTLDFLYLTIGISTIILVIFVSIAIIQLILVLRDLRKITDTAGTITEHFHQIVATPLYYIGKVGEAIGPHLEKLIKDKLKKNK